jgi:exodeoxyribonuclease VII large subunit
MADDGDPTYTVGGLTEAINRRLREGFGRGVWVAGEVSGLRASGAHLYFSLVEDVDGAKATLNVSLFANVKRTVMPKLAQNRVELVDGTRVRIRGTLDVYAPSGRLSLKVSDIDPQFTLGDISAARDAVMARLAADDLLDRNARLPLPVVPLRVGVVTSIGSAAWHDFRDEIVRSGYGFHLLGIDARVQGDQAEAMVVAGIGRAVALAVDVVVVVRGGGARNDLAAFDSEGIARAIATCPVPVWTGLGHEIDRTVADEVAHTAHKTPTACADALVDLVAARAHSAEQTWSAITAAATAQVAAAGTALGSRAARVASRTHQAVARSDERLRARTDRLGRVGLMLERARAGIDERDRRVALLDPVRLLERGWSITTRDDGRPVRGIADVAIGERLSTRLADGTVTSTVTGTVDGTEEADGDEQH